MADPDRRAPSLFEELDRRAFLMTSGRYSFWGLFAAVTGMGRVAFGQGERPPDYEGGYSRPLTPGFAQEPVTEEQRVLAAIIDTVVPGSTSDPTGAPGALEAGALNLTYDDFYPVRPYIAAMVQLIQLQADRRHGSAFDDLTLEQREGVLWDTQELLPFLRHAYRFFRGVFFADLHGGVGSQYIDFPGPNLGYVDHPEFSYRRPMSEEMTEDGNMP